MNAIFILKGICFTSKRDNDEKVILHIKRTYAQKLEDIISSSEENLFNSKTDVKQILGFISNEEERFHIYSRAWKVCAKIEDDHRYTNSIAAFIIDLERANPKFKYSVRRELYELIENSPNPIVKKRAKEMKAFLFS